MLAKKAKIPVIVDPQGNNYKRYKGVDESRLREIALDDDSIKSFIGDKEIKKIIIVPNRIINIVV